MYTYIYNTEHVCPSFQSCVFSTELLGATSLVHSKAPPPPISRKFPHPPIHTKKVAKSVGKLQGLPIRRTRTPTTTKPVKKLTTKSKRYDDQNAKHYVTYKMGQAILFIVETLYYSLQLYQESSFITGALKSVLHKDDICPFILSVLYRTLLCLTACTYFSLIHSHTYIAPPPVNSSVRATPHGFLKIREQAPTPSPQQQQAMPSETMSEEMWHMGHSYGM